MPRKGKRNAGLGCKKKSGRYRTKKAKLEEEATVSTSSKKSLFEGKSGKDVESEEAVSWYHTDAIKEKKYHDRAAFRVVVGPSIALWGDCGYEESLYGLQIDLDFGVFGSLRGIVQQQHDPFKISWRCGPDFDNKKRGVETFTSTTTMEASEIVAWYYLQKKERPTWVNEGNEYVGTAAQSFIHSLRSAAKGTKLVNWQRISMEAYGFFEELEKSDMNERMDVTMHKLNDPEGAMSYGPDKIFPIPFLLALYAYSITIDPSTALPILTNDKNKELFIYVDRFAHFLVKRDDETNSRTGYKQLGGLEAIVDEYSNEKVNSEKSWRKAYLYAQALMLLLSDKFEESIWTYKMVDDIDRLDQLCSDILNVFNSVMLPSCAPNESTREQLRKDLQFNDQHLNAGSFMTIVTDESFQKEKRNKDRLNTFQGCLRQNSNPCTM